MDNHASRPEIAGAWRAARRLRRFSNTLQQNVVYVAVAVKRDSRRSGVVRLPSLAHGSQVARIRAEFWAIGGIVALLALR
jgi:hypothetical protein